MLGTPRSEGDQEVKISELNLNDAARGKRQRFPLSHFGSGLFEDLTDPLPIRPPQSFRARASCNRALQARERWIPLPPCRIAMAGQEGAI